MSEARWSQKSYMSHIWACNSLRYRNIWTLNTAPRELFTNCLIGDAGILKEKKYQDARNSLDLDPTSNASRWRLPVNSYSVVTETHWHHLVMKPENKTSGKNNRTSQKMKKKDTGDPWDWPFLGSIWSANIWLSMSSIGMHFNNTMMVMHALLKSVNY